MSWAIIAAITWALAATGTALLPLQQQLLPGLCLLVAAPVLIFWIGAAYGWVWAALALAAFMSMFRRPLGHMFRLALRRAGGGV